MRSWRTTLPILDTSFLVAAWNLDHPDNAAARKRLAQQTNEADPVLRINAGALAEASRILRRLAKDAGLDGNGAARHYLTTFLRLPGTTIEARFADEAWPRYLEQTSLSFVDAWILEQALRLGDEVWTYDRGLQKALKGK